jgi:hypothetical protein
MDRSDAQTAAVDFPAQACFLLLRRFPQQPVAVSQSDVCRDLLPNVLVECENALVGQEFYSHDRPRPSSGHNRPRNQRPSSAIIISAFSKAWWFSAAHLQVELPFEARKASQSGVI